MGKTLAIYRDNEGYGADQVLDIFHYDYEIEPYVQKEIGLEEMFADEDFIELFSNDKLLLNAYKHVLKTKSKKYNEVINDLMSRVESVYTEHCISEIRIDKGLVRFYTTYNEEGFMDCFYNDTIVECENMKALFEHIRNKKDIRYIPEYYIDEDLQNWEYFNMKSAEEFEDYMKSKYEDGRFFIVCCHQ